jgi:hypothetical protein
MAERSSLRTAARQLADGLLRVAELTVIAAAGCLLAAVLLAWLLGRRYGPTAVLVCGFVGVGMIFGGTWQNMPMGPLTRTRRRSAAVARRREEERDPAMRARREVEERRGATVISQGGILSVAGLLLVLVGFLADVLVDHGG